MTKRIVATAKDGTFYDIYIRRPRKLEYGLLEVNTVKTDGLIISVTIPMRADDLADNLTSYGPDYTVESYWHSLAGKIPCNVVIPKEPWEKMKDEVKLYYRSVIDKYYIQKTKEKKNAANIG